MDQPSAHSSKLTRLVIRAGGSTVRGLAIGRFHDYGIWLDGCDNNVIQGNHPRHRCCLEILSGKTMSELRVTKLFKQHNRRNDGRGPQRDLRKRFRRHRHRRNEQRNVIQGNYIGTNAAGTTALRNNIDGINLSGQFTNTLIGGTTPGAGNLISGNERGITSRTPGTTIQGKPDRHQRRRDPERCKQRRHPQRRRETLRSVV
jgi:hypothetical protein